MKKRVLSILAIGLIVANVNAATVARIDGKEKSAVENNGIGEASVKYVGEVSETDIMFDVDFNNPSGKTFLLVIFNSQGDELYNQVFKGADFHKTIMVKKDADMVGNIRFALKRGGNDIYSQAFSIDTQTRIVKNVVVKSVN